MENLFFFFINKICILHLFSRLSRYSWSVDVRSPSLQTRQDPTVPAPDERTYLRTRLHCSSYYLRRVHHSPEDRLSSIRVVFIYCKTFFFLQREITKNKVCYQTSSGSPSLFQTVFQHSVASEYDPGLLEPHASHVLGENRGGNEMLFEYVERLTEQIF